MDPEAQLVCGGAEAQARQALANLKHVLEAGGASLESVIKTTILLNDISDFQAVNQVYAECEWTINYNTRRIRMCPEQRLDTYTLGIKLNSKSLSIPIGWFNILTVM